MPDEREASPKVCLFCAHYCLDPGERAYSELTPGGPGETGCRKGHWRIGPSDGDERDLRKEMQRAAKCPDYAYYKEVEDEF